MSRADSPLAGALIFVVGAQRSGTNWLQALLALHPQVAAIPSETALFSHGIAHLEERTQDGLVSSTKTGRTYVPRDVFLDAARDFCDTVFGTLRDALDPNASRLVERTPMHVRHLRLIADVYPDAKVVHLIRDGRDVALSLAAQSWGPSSVAAAAQEWVDAVSSARGARIAAYREVRHEALSADPAQVMADLFGWLGLDVDDALRAAVAARAPRAVNVTAGNPSTDIDKWRTSASADDLAAIEAVAGSLLRELRYTDAPPEAGAAAMPGRRRSWRERRRDGSAPTPASSTPAEDLQELVDVLLSGVQRADAERVARTLTERCVVLVNGREIFGEPSDALIAAVIDHRDLVQVRGAAYPDGSSTAVHLASRRPDGSEVLEAFVLVHEVSSGRFRKVIYHGPARAEPVP
ncbi:MAG TPA: sulfotransferase [Mycobacteriales bacterium]|nr:sulfotransferase [Mycobacteriales bacterium]